MHGKTGTNENPTQTVLLSKLAFGNSDLVTADQHHKVGKAQMTEKKAGRKSDLKRLFYSFYIVSHRTMRFSFYDNSSLSDRKCIVMFVDWIRGLNINRPSVESSVVYTASASSAAVFYLHLSHNTPSFSHISCQQDSFHFICRCHQ